MKSIMSGSSSHGEKYMVYYFSMLKTYSAWMLEPLTDGLVKS